MVSPFKRHQQRVHGREAAARSIGRTAAKLDQVLAGGERSPAATAYDRQVAEMAEDLRALSEIQSIETKIARKAELLPKYDDWCAGVIEAAAAADGEGKRLETDVVLVQTMIWAIDCADAERALPRATVVIRHRMELPARFERTAGCMIAEEFAETALKALKLDEAAAPPIAPLLEVRDLTAEEDMPDQVRAKLERAIGEVIQRGVDLDAEGSVSGKRSAIAAVIGHFKRALQLDTHAGVKKLIEARERDLRDLGAAADEES